MDWEPRYRRFQECQRYVAWSDYDAQRVRSLATIVDPSLQPLVDDFYAEIERHVHTSRIISGGQQQMSRLKEALLCWLRDLFTGSYDRDYLRRRYEVGRQHVQMGLDQTYTILAMSRLRSGLLADVSVRVAKTIGRRLLQFERRLRGLLFLSNRERLASVLLDLARQSGVATNDGISLQIRLSHHDLANIIGCSRETVSVEMAKLRSDGLIDSGRQRIILTQPRRLAELISRNGI